MPISNLVGEVRRWSTAEHAALGVFTFLAFCCGLMTGLGLFGFSTLALVVGSGAGVVLGAGTLAFMVVVRLLVGE